MSLSHPLISVIVPAFNAARWIDRTLASIQAQTHREIEILVVDDGSTDDTVDHVLRVAATDSRIRLVRQANAGPAAARNRGIRESRGVFVAPIDADDLWAPDNLERQVTALILRPDAAFCLARSYWLDEDDRLLAPASNAPLPECSFQSLLEDNFIGNGSACVFRRAHLDAVGGYDERYGGGGEDWLLTLSLAARAPFVCVDDYLIGYRQGAETFSARKAEAMCAALLRIIDEMRRKGPPLPAASYRRARTRGLIWNMPRLRRAGAWLAILRYGATAFLANPDWRKDPRAQAFVAGVLQRGRKPEAQERQPPVRLLPTFAEATQRAREPRRSDYATEGAA
ncbi:MAG: glycosyltransferase family 2 protein [Alphaproteobacteria bacterium]|nr:glycosyltransferase family 2 protein [Alphaproteobacteria bacterium]